jgi:hypothetical protein
VEVAETRVNWKDYALPLTSVLPPELLDYPVQDVHFVCVRTS